MSIFQDRQNRNCFFFLIFFQAGLVLLSLAAGRLQLAYTAEALLETEGRIASRLLDQGISAEILAGAFSGEETTAAGREFLQQIGHQHPVSLYLLPGVSPGAAKFLLFCVTAALGMGLILFLGLLCHMKRREALFCEAADRVERFAKGDFSCSLSENQEGTLYRFFASVDHLAAALKAKSEEEQKTKEFLKDTISDISHQLKTPLSALWMYTEIIGREPENPETVRRFSERSMASLTRIEELIQSLLKMARLEMKSIHFERRMYPVRELVERAVQNLSFRAGQEHKELLIQGDREACGYFDLPWTGEALENLVKNALDHTEEGGTIRISWEGTRAMCCVTVEDDGCGILPEDLYHIFKRFYRSSASKDHQGAGLGLPLARGIVEGQGGTLSVSSSPGEGSRFSMMFLT